MKAVTIEGRDRTKSTSIRRNLASKVGVTTQQLRKYEEKLRLYVPDFLYHSCTSHGKLKKGMPLTPYQQKQIEKFRLEMTKHGSFDRVITEIRVHPERWSYLHWEKYERFNHDQ